MTGPWIETTHVVAAVRWLDQFGALALRGKAVLGQSDVYANLHRTQQPALQQVVGQATVQATLSVRQLVAGASPGGTTTVSGLLGWLQLAQASSSGRSQVSGDLIVGVGQVLAGVSNGQSGARGTLAVKQYSFISGTQAGEDWSANEPVTRAGRDDGHTRRRFTPHSTGRTNERETWQR